MVIGIPHDAGQMKHWEALRPIVQVKADPKFGQLWQASGGTLPICLNGSAAISVLIGSPPKPKPVAVHGWGGCRGRANLRVSTTAQKNDDHGVSERAVLIGVSPPVPAKSAGSDRRFWALAGSP